MSVLIPFYWDIKFPFPYIILELEAKSSMGLAAVLNERLIELSSPKSGLKVGNSANLSPTQYLHSTRILTAIERAEWPIPPWL